MTVRAWKVYGNGYCVSGDRYERRFGSYRFIQCLGWGLLEEEEKEAGVIAIIVIKGGTDEDVEDELDWQKTSPCGLLRYENISRMEEIPEADRYF